MTRVLSLAIAVMTLSLSTHAQTAPDGEVLTKLLKDFLAGASRNDAAMHDRFWAEDLIYTGSAGRRIGKADIMRDNRPAPAPRPGAPTTTYSAEDIRIQQYGDTAIVAFRLIGKTENDGKIQIARYFNTGTFLKRNGKWQAVSWQATRIPRTAEESKKEVTEAEADFHHAVLNADVKKLESMTDESFIWTHNNGEQMTRRQLLDDLGSGRLKYSKLVTTNVTVLVDGDAAVVRGSSERQRSSVPGAAGDATPFTTFYTLTFVNKGGAWKAVAMHSSRPQ